MVVGDGTYAAHGSHRGRQLRDQQHQPPAGGSGVRYLKLTRTGNTYQSAISLNGDVAASYTTSAVRTFAAGLPQALNVGFAMSSSNNTNISASATFSDVHIVDPSGNEIIGPNEFSGEIGAGTPGGGGGGGPRHPRRVRRIRTTSRAAQRRPSRRCCRAASLTTTSKGMRRPRSRVAAISPTATRVIAR